MRLAALLLAVLLAGCMSTPPPSRARSGRAPQPRSAGSTEGGPTLRAADLEAAIHAGTNAARRRQRLAPLAYAQPLAGVARRYSEDMARRGFFGHVDPDGRDATDRAARHGVTCRVAVGNRIYEGVNENLAQDWRFSGWQDRRSATGTTRTYTWLTRDQIADRTVQGWMDSPGHRRNLLNPNVSREGLGVYIAADGAIYITQLLC